MSEGKKQQEPPWINYKAAMARIDSLDVPTQQFTMRAVTLVVSAFQFQSITPDSPLDLLYYVERMIEFYGQRRELVRIFAGEDLRW